MILNNKIYTGYFTFNSKNYYMDDDLRTIVAIDFDNDTIFYQKTIISSCGCCSEWADYDMELTEYLTEYCNDTDDFIKHIEDNWHE